MVPKSIYKLSVLAVLAVLAALAALALQACNAPAAIDAAEDVGVCTPCPSSGKNKIARVLVLGDRTGRPDDKVFHAALTEAAKLKPDLILCVGDLIEGYQPDERIEEAQEQWNWVLKTIRNKLGDIPIYSTPGNHDIWSKKSEELFAKNIGHEHNYSFDIDNVRVIIFDSSRVKDETEIEEEHLNWLVSELYNARDHAKRIVVSHVPLWAIGDGGTYGSQLHDVFIAGRVDWVLTGHWHHAMSDDRDGIRYRMIGPSGTHPHRPGHKESGNFKQFGFLTIDDGEVELSLIPLGSLLESDTFPYEFNQLEWKIENRSVQVEGFLLDPMAPKQSGRFFVNLTNVSDRPLNSEITASDDRGVWKLISSNRDIKLKPGESKKVAFNFRRSNKTRIFPGPSLTISFPWPEDKTYVLKKELHPILFHKIKHTNDAPTVDGRLDENVWTNLRELGPLWYPSGVPFEGRVKTRALSSNSKLFLGIEATEPHAHSQDTISILLDLDPNDQTCLMVTFTPSGNMQTFNVDLLSGSSTVTTMQIVDAYKITKTDNTWSIETSIPMERISNTKNVRFNIGLSNDTAHRDPVSWQPLLEHNLPSFGELRLPY